IELKLGDGRLQMQKAPDDHYDLIFMDAFNSDAVPVHLLTREAVEMYLTKLAPHGVIVVNVANRYLDFSPLFANLPERMGKEADAMQEGADEMEEEAARMKKEGDREGAARMTEEARRKREESKNRRLAVLYGPGYRSDWNPFTEEYEQYGSAWIVIARDWDDLRELIQHGWYDPKGWGWYPPDTDPAVGVWTDSFSNVLAIFDWKR